MIPRPRLGWCATADARAACLAAGLLLVAANPGQAQLAVDSVASASGRPRWTARALGEARLAEHRVDAGNGVELSSGTLFGGQLRLTVGSQLEVGLGGATGSLTADSVQADDATLTNGAAHVAILPVPWLALRAGGEIHSYANDFAVQRWTSLRLGAEGRLRFIGGKVSGLVRFEFFPVVSVSGLPKPSRAFGAASGLSFTSGAVTASVLYELERYDFPQSAGVERQDQLGYLVIALGLVLGR